MADTALDLITNALLDLGVLADEETPTSSQAAGGLRKLNNLIESWNIEGLMPIGGTAQTFPLVSNQGTYTLGVGGDFNTARPNIVTACYVRDTTQPVATRVDYPLYMYTEKEFSEVPLKGLESTLPMGVYFDNATPLTNVTFYPIPSTANYTFVMWSDVILPSLTLTQQIAVAPGYARALEANLAVELAASYGVVPSESLVAIALTSKENLKIKNFDLNELNIDPRLTGNVYFNYITGGYNNG